MAGTVAYRTGMNSTLYSRAGVATELRRRRREVLLRQEQLRERAEYWARQRAIIAEKRRNRTT